MTIRSRRPIFKSSNPPKGSTDRAVASIKHKMSVASYYLLAILAVLLVISLIRNIKVVIDANLKINEAKNQLAALVNQNKDIQKKAQEVDSVYFKEKQARDKLGYAKAEDVVIVLPPAEILKRLSPVIHEVEASETPSEPNWKKWWKMFF